MKITLWSAGENGKIAKTYKICGYIIFILWIIAVISIICNGPYVVNSINPKLESLMFGIFFVVITSFIPFLALATIHISKECIKRNTKFTVEVIKNVDRFRRNDIRASNIVYGDVHGIVVSNNPKAFDDWNFFYKVDSLYDFYEVRDKLGIT